MLHRLSAKLAAAKDILQTEGAVSLLRRGFDFSRRSLFQHGRYYLYEHSLEERNEADFMPRIHDFVFKIISSNEEADELAASIGHDFRHCFINARRTLDKGAIAFCIFVDGRIAHIGWVALTEEAKQKIDCHPYEVEFANKIACTGGTETVPEHRGKGLMVYGYFKRFQYLREKGLIASRNAVAVDNIASQKAHAKFGPKKYATARYLKLLGWEYWRESPTEPVDHTG